MPAHSATVPRRRAALRRESTPTEPKLLRDLARFGVLGRERERCAEFARGLTRTPTYSHQATRSGAHRTA